MKRFFFFLFDVIDFIEHIPSYLVWCIETVCVLTYVTFRHTFVTLRYNIAQWQCKMLVSSLQRETQYERMNAIHAIEHMAADRGIRLDYVNSVVTLYPPLQQEVTFNWNEPGSLFHTTVWLLHQPGLTCAKCEKPIDKATSDTYHGCCSPACDNDHGILIIIPLS